MRSLRGRQTAVNSVEMAWIAGNSRAVGRMRSLLPCALQDSQKATTAMLNLRLIGKPIEAFLSSQYRQDVEDPGRGGLAGQRRAQRLGDGAELDAFALRQCARCRFRVGGGPVGDAVQHVTQLA